MTAGQIAQLDGSESDALERNHLMSAHPNFKYAGTNPCAEEPLPPGGSCLLGSINLAAFVKNPFTKNAVFNMSEYIEAIKESVVALNEVLDEGLELHPLEVQKKTVKELRQIGLGVMGISDMLIKLGITYGSEDALALCDTLASTLLRYSLISSSHVAKEHGSFDWYDWEYLSKSEFFQQKVDEDVKKLIKRQGLRNSQILCIAPTGSISTMLGISGGIEPTFAFSFKRTTKSLHGKDVTYNVEADIVNEYREVTGNKGELPEYFIASHQLDWRQRIDMQSVWQNYIDASISSTINLGKDVTMDEVEDLYLYAWEKGLKGATIFHAGGKRAAILVSDDDKKDEKEEETVQVEQKERASGFYSTCPECGSDQMFQSAGCVTCNDCGFSPCS